jgi:hypothetical protein
MRLLSGILLVMLTAAPASAQTGRFYAGGVFGAHVESADFVDGWTPAAGVVIGTRLSRSWGLELEAGRPTDRFVRESTAIGIAFPPAGSSPLTQNDLERYGVLQHFIRERTVSSLVSLGVVYQPRVHPRWQPRLFAGVVNKTVQERFATDVLRLPPDVDPERLRSVGPTDERHTRNLGGLSFGGGLGFAVSPHLSIAPEFRYDYGSIGDEINNSVRSSVRAVWSF